MASLIKRRSSKNADADAVAVAADGNKGKNAPAFCKKHPKHRQSPGVCSLCLNEKLSQFIAKASSSSRNKIRISCSSSSSSLSSYCSSSVSSCPSPLHRRYPFFSTGAGAGEAKGSLLWLTKSRSIAFVPRTSTIGKKDCGDHDERMIKRRGKRGWFSTLIDPRRKK